MNLQNCLLSLNIFLKMFLIANSTRTQCLQHLWEKLGKNGSVITNFESHVNVPIFKLNRLTKELQSRFSEIRFDIVIINEEVFNSETFLLWDVQRESFNPSATYIIFGDKVTTKIFDIFGKYYVDKVYAVNKNFSVFAYRPYRYESVDNPEKTPVTLGSCLTTFKELTYQMPRRWRNTTFQVCNRVVEPYTTRKYDGLENILIEIIEETLGLKINYVDILRHINDENMNILSMDEHLSVKGMNLLKHYESDILVGYNSLTKDAPKRFELTFPIFYDSLVWVYPFPRKMNYWKRISLIFSLDLWIFLLVVTSVWIFIVHIVESAVPLHHLFFVVFQVLFENSVPRSLFRNKNLFKVLFSAWILAFLIVSTLFKNSFLLILGTVKREPDLENLADILKMNFKMSSYINLSDLYLDFQGHEEYPLDFEGVEYCPSVLGCVNRTAFEKFFVTIAPRSLVLYNWIPKFYITHYGEMLVRVNTDIIKPINVHLILSKGYPLYQQINDILMRLAETGWIDHIYVQMQTQIKRTTNLRVFEAKKIGMSKFRFVFAIWGFGLLLASAVFSLEVLWQVLKMCKYSYQC